VVALLVLVLVLLVLVVLVVVVLVVVVMVRLPLLGFLRPFVLTNLAIEWTSDERRRRSKSSCFSASVRLEPMIRSDARERPPRTCVLATLSRLEYKASSSPVILGILQAINNLRCSMDECFEQVVEYAAAAATAAALTDIIVARRERTSFTLSSSDRAMPPRPLFAAGTAMLDVLDYQCRNRRG